MHWFCSCTTHRCRSTSVRPFSTCVGSGFRKAADCWISSCGATELSTSSSPTTTTLFFVSERASFRTLFCLGPGSRGLWCGDELSLVLFPGGNFSSRGSCLHLLQIEKWFCLTPTLKTRGLLLFLLFCVVELIFWSFRVLVLFLQMRILMMMNLLNASFFSFLTFTLISKFLLPFLLFVQEQFILVWLILLIVSLISFSWSSTAILVSQFFIFLTLVYQRLSDLFSFPLISIISPFFFSSPIYCDCHISSSYLSQKKPLFLFLFISQDDLFFQLLPQLPHFQ